MSKRLLLAVAVCTVAFAGVSASGALAFGPAPPPGNPDATKQLEACSAAFDRQAKGGVTAGGGPKAGEPGPLNCDHFFQDEGSPAANHIGNGWPPPPFQP
jgi:hypothetical protein